MWIDNNFSQFYLSMPMCLSVQAITFATLKVGTLFLSTQIYLDYVQVIVYRSSSNE